jgi:sigma-B regulation protein RsbU (phosphoserine phosphatase)
LPTKLENVMDKIGNDLILIVDDDQLIRMMISAYLKEAGFQNLEFALDGGEAVQKIQTLSPDCVILDINMPVQDGFYVLDQVRNKLGNTDIPILVSTAMSDHDDRNRILRAGATNLISKPLDSILLVERVIDVLERQHLFRTLKEYQHRMSAELNLAREMQENLMPTQSEIDALMSHYGCKLDSHFLTSSELGGDFWGVSRVDDTRFSVFVADLVGHGVSAALNTFCVHSLMNEIETNRYSPAEYLTVLNQKLSGVLALGQFATMFYAIVDVKNEILTYAAAACPDPIFGSTRPTPKVEFGDGTGFPLSINENATYVDHVVPFGPDDFLFMYSDALIETKRTNADAIGFDGLKEEVNRALKADPDKPMECVLKSFFDEVELPLPDDLTAVWITYN